MRAVAIDSEEFGNRGAYPVTVIHCLVARSPLMGEKEPKQLIHESNGLGKMEELSVQTVAESLLLWAKENGALASDASLLLTKSDVHTNPFPTLAGPEGDEVEQTEKTLERLKIVTVAVDESNRRATVLTQNKISDAAAKKLPQEIEGVKITYIGQSGIESNPPHLPQSGVGSAPRTFVHNNRLSCGSSLTAAPIHGAGTLGALVALADGTLCGISNNHVTGACNHTIQDMHILCPSPMDADPAHLAPTAIGRHHSFVPLASGDPGQVALQGVDAALFKISLANVVTSMQGNSFYDTPVATVVPSPGVLVKKVGRTTGLTHGIIIGRNSTPIAIPYEAPRFRSTVYFDNVWLVKTVAGGPFSLGGDSGSLVVTQDGQSAVGLIFAGSSSGDVSFIIPIDAVLSEFGATLVSGHGI